MTDIIEGEATEVRELPGSSVPAVYVEPPRGLAIAPTPGELVKLATSMADALYDIVERKKLYTTISGKKYPDVEAWLTIARMDNVVAREHGLPVRREDGSYEAIVDLIRLSDGMVVGQGSAICGTKDDPPWNSRGEQAKRGMAVTRATSRACRQHYAWIMAIAGYQPTPAEDMPRDDPQPGNPAPPARSAPSAPRNVTPAPDEAPGPSDEAVLQLVVSETPEGNVRIVKDAHHVKRWEGERAKLEVVGKIANRKHTAIILGPLAEAAAAFGIAEGDVVQFVGAVVEEIVWQEGKPTKKEIWGQPPGYLMDDVLVGRDGAWVSVTTAMPTLGMDAPVGNATLAAAEAETVTHREEGPVVGTATPARRQGTVGEYETLRIKLQQPVQRTLRGQTLVAILRGIDTTTGELVMAGLANDIDEQLGTEEEPFVTAGDEVTMYGEWKPQGWYVIDTVGKAR